jgi:hypothetical protein
MRHSSTITCATAFQVENYISILLYLHPVAKFELAAVSFTVRPEIVWSHHIFTVCCLWCSHTLMPMTSTISFFLISVFSIQQPTYKLLCTTYILSSESLMYVTYFSLFSYILSPNLLYPLLYKYTVILKLHVLHFILLPTSSYSASVLPQFLFIYQYIQLFCSICLYFYIFCIFYVPKSLPTIFLFNHTSKSGHYFPVSAYPCLLITFLYHPPHYAAPFSCICLCTPICPSLSKLLQRVSHLCFYIILHLLFITLP